MRPRFAILGCGNGGQTMAADLVLRGFDVVGVYDRFEDAVGPVRTRGGVELIGSVMQGFAPLRNVSTDLDAAIEGADVLMVVVPSFAHAWLAEQLGPRIRAGQTVLLHPGYFGGSILFKRILVERGAPGDTIVGEAHILIYATRIVGPAVVGVRGVKQWVQVAAFPAVHTPRLMMQVGEAFPQFVPAEHVLETGVNNPNPIIHTPIYLLNFARIEQGDAPVAFDFHEWMTPSVERLHAALDEERVSLARALGLNPLSYDEINQRSYRGGGRKIVPAERGVPKNAESLPPRFIVEDIPMGLVPLASLGRALGVPTQTIEGVINIACAATGQDFWREGRTLAAIGLDGYGTKQMVEFVRTGQATAVAV